MSSRSWSRLAALAVTGALAPALAGAQPLGTFRWQLQPYCNLVTLHVTRIAGEFTLDGFDDQCGGPVRAAVVGMAFLNPDGTVGIGLTTVLAPGGTPVHVDARIDLGSLGGPWQDNAGRSGTFVFTRGPGMGGAPRPIAPNGLAPGSITSVQIAPGAVGVAQLAPGLVGAAQIDPTQVQARVRGSCPVGQYVRGIRPDGSVVCELRLAANASTTVDDLANDVGRDTSIAIGADGLPVISQRVGGAGALRVTHCGNAACSTANVSTTVDDPENDVGNYTSIAIGADGLPVIGHFDDNAGALRVTHCGNAACTANNVSTIVDDLANAVGVNPSIAIGTDGLPIISHQDATAGTLRVTHCGNAACTTGNVSTSVDDPANAVGQFTSVAIGADGLPIISHLDGTANALRVSRCIDVACTAAVSANVDDPAAAVGAYTSIAIGADDLPIISHFDVTHGALRVTKCATRTCQ
jgi:predicted regulator of Ras-like GTPase activity (Roadblock/LC7/MglB family)